MEHFILTCRNKDGALAKGKRRRRFGHLTDDEIAWMEQQVRDAFEMHRAD